MLYRWRQSNNILMMTDLADIFFGQTMFIIGGHPSIKNMPLDLLTQPGVLTMALNNVPFVFPKPTVWLTADKPSCYGGHIYHRPDIIKLARLDSSLDVPSGSDKQLRTFPNMLFYELNAEKYTPENFLSPGVDFAWQKSVFPISIQMAWRLGIRKLFLVGCAFWTSMAASYAWDVRLTEKQKTNNQLTYNADVSYFAGLKPYLDANGFEVISCTPDSRINDFCKFIPLAEAVESVKRTLPGPASTVQLLHSSQS